MFKSLFLIIILLPLGVFSAANTNSDIQEKYFTQSLETELQTLYPWLAKNGYSVSNSNKISRSLRQTYKSSKLPNSVLDIRVALYSSGSSKVMFKDASSEYSTRMNDWVWLPVIRTLKVKGFDLVGEVTSKPNPKYTNTSRRTPGNWRNAIYIIKDKVVVEIIYSPEFKKTHMYLIGKKILGISTQTSKDK